MGVCCENETESVGSLPVQEKTKITTKAGEKAPAATPPAPVAPVVEQIKDLPVVKWEGIKDVYERFEKSLPFNRIKVDVMM